MSDVRPASKWGDAERLAFCAHLVATGQSPATVGHYDQAVRAFQDHLPADGISIIGSPVDRGPVHAYAQALHLAGIAGQAATDRLELVTEFLAWVEENGAPTAARVARWLLAEYEQLTGPEPVQLDQAGVDVLADVDVRRAESTGIDVAGGGDDRVDVVVAADPGYDGGFDPGTADDFGLVAATDPGGPADVDDMLAVSNGGRRSAVQAGDEPPAPMVAIDRATQASFPAEVVAGSRTPLTFEESEGVKGEGRSRATSTSRRRRTRRRLRSSSSCTPRAFRSCSRSPRRRNRRSSGSPWT